jgi:hypothetical protein
MNSQQPSGITAAPDGFTVDVELLARQFHVSPEAFWLELKRGTVSGVVERGEGADAGRTRLSFRYRGRHCSLLLDSAAV